MRTMSRWGISLLATALILSSTGSAWSQCVEYDDYHHYVGGCDSPGIVNAVCVSRDRAYAADGEYGLAVFDLSDPSHPVMMSEVTTTGTAQQVVASGPYVFVGNHEGGLHVFDVTDPSNPSLCGGIGFPDVLQCIGIEGSLVLMSHHATGIRIIDIGNPCEPDLVGEVAVAGDVRSLEVRDGIVYALQDDRIDLIDITDTANPETVGSVQLPGLGTDIAVAGGYAYVINSVGHLMVVNVEDPRYPILTHTTGTQSSVRAVAVKDDRVVVSFIRGIQSFDLANPEYPTPTDILYNGADTKDVAFFGGMVAVAAGSHGIQVFDVGRPDALSPTAVYGTPVSATAITVSGSLAFISYYSYYSDSFTEWTDAGVHLVDISDPGSPHAVKSVATSVASDVVVRDGLAYVADGSEGLVILDCSDPAHAGILSSLFLSAYAHHLFVSDALAFVSVNSGSARAGLRVIDISDPLQPVLLGSADAPGTSYDIAVRGDNAFLAFGEDGVLVADVTDPRRPNSWPRWRRRATPSPSRSRGRTCSSPTVPAFT